MGSVLKKINLITFYHEHPRTYSLKSFIFISKRLGLDILNVKFLKDTEEILELLWKKKNQK